MEGWSPPPAAPGKRAVPNQLIWSPDVSEPNGERVAAISAELAEFIVNDLNWDGTTEDLLAEDRVALPEILDSTDLLELAGFLEDTYGIAINDEEIVAENFASVHDVARLVVSKQAALEAT
jgi:acyl carrier protein